MRELYNCLYKVLLLGIFLHILDKAPVDLYIVGQELEEVGLAAPQVTYIMHALNDAGLKVNCEVTTVIEAADEIVKALKGRK